MGLPAEPGQVPDEVRFEEEDEDNEAAAAARASSGAGASTSNAAAAAAAALAAAGTLPDVDPAHISTTPRPHDLSPRVAGGAAGLPAGALLHTGVFVCVGVVVCVCVWVWLCVCGCGCDR